MEKRKSKIGGQALIEGVMMRGLDCASMAVRLPNNKIHIETFKVDSLINPKWYRKIPIIRGVFGMVSSLVLGYKCLMKSAKLVMEEDDEKNNSKAVEIFSIVGTIFGILISIFLFTYLPSLIVKTTNLAIFKSGVIKSLFEGTIKIALFVGYVFLISFFPDTRRIFEYHGAEHKTIACYEADEALTIENIKKFTRFHPRCGTSFILIAALTSILVFSFLTWNKLLIRLILKFTLLPLVVGLSYEIIQFAGRHDNILTKIISAPGLFLQRLTTNEPDENQIEIALKAFKEVIPKNKELDRW